jgi:hypothetical protein
MDSEALHVEFWFDKSLAYQMQQLVASSNVLYHILGFCSLIPTATMASMNPIN